ncbi:adenosylcobyric acid synthase [Bacillus mesophilus]|uniref:Cobyric acid synthase n=1 Tax=Bacillus mesophilus TaxID=1808955 RepID=A0A6M0QBM6_9BACI|nr:cobyric acid synthase [Bacillus mesophilus]MBM7660088.1 adenosylcobyric acid synthase [Bacillus mesophilus]NEY73743.1 cobyric acid synthase [Bacillus mesophilus]
MTKALPIMIQGTHSDAGKSIVATALCRIFSEDGFTTAPFKSQNMSLNSYITLDGKEIGRAQGVQAEAARVAATTDMNPILIKPTKDYESQIVVHGKPLRNMKAGEYRQDYFETGLAIIKESLDNLMNSYERVVIEGAGSPAEINLNDHELVNMRVAKLANAPVILVGDIDKGGVFASLVGTLQLLKEDERDRVIGVIINKFRGDLSLLEPGLTWFEEYTGKPVLGVIPFIPNLRIDAEDSVMLNQYHTKQNPSKDIDIAVIRYPMISNFTDVDPFMVEPDCHVRFVTTADELKDPDLVILPGSKNTIDDLQYLQQTGLKEKLLELINNKSTMVFGVCGGYQMLGKEVIDPYGVESTTKVIKGMNLLPISTIITKEKTTIRKTGILTIFDKSFDVTGYEIHMGVSQSEYLNPLIQTEEDTDGCKSIDDLVFGTYFHDIFHNDLFRQYLLNKIRKNKGLSEIFGRNSYNLLRETEYDRLSKHVRKHVDLDYIQKQMELFKD